MNRPTAAQKQDGSRGRGAGVGLHLHRDGISFGFFSKLPTTEQSVATGLFEILYPNFGEPEMPTQQQLSARRYNAARYLLEVLIKSSGHPETGLLTVDAGYGFKVQFINSRVSPAEAGGDAEAMCVTLSKQPLHTSLVALSQPVLIGSARTRYKNNTTPTPLNQKGIISSLSTAVDCLRQKAGIHIAPSVVVSPPGPTDSRATRFENLLARILGVDPR
ncbi:MAG: hypothetical protein JNK33_06095 [Candidatus Doudnabacteria bacterium]|nr:hypothetical protein [Candidatus Doudnabacteria bacterium]